MNEIDSKTEIELCSKWHDVYTYLKGGMIPDNFEEIITHINEAELREGVITYLEMKKKNGIYDWM